MENPPPKATVAASFIKGAARNYASRKTKEERTHKGVVYDSMDEMRAFMAAESIVPQEWLHTGETFLLLPKKVIHTRGERKLVRQMTWACDLMVGPARLHNESPIGPQHLVIDIKGSIKMVTEQFKVRLKIFEWRYEQSATLCEISTKAKMAAFQDLLRRHVQYLQFLYP